VIGEGRIIGQAAVYTNGVSKAIVGTTGLKLTT
jgi:hypothetical protein